MNLKRVTYKELCEIFDEEEKKGGRNRQLQLDKWREEYSIEKVNGKSLYEIREYTSLEKRELEIYKNCKSCIKPLLYKMLSKVEDNHVQWSSLDMLVNLYMVNENYRFCTDYEEDIAERILEAGNYEDWLVEEKPMLVFNAEDFYWEVYKILKNVLNEVLHEMKEAQLIDFTRPRAKLCYNSDRTIRVKEAMTHDENEKWMRCCRDYAIDKFGIDYEKCNYYQKNECMSYATINCGYIKVFDMYDITLNREGIRMKYDKLQLEELQDFTNRSIIDKINNSKQGKLKDMNPNIKNLLVKVAIDKTYTNIIRPKYEN